MLQLVRYGISVALALALLGHAAGLQPLPLVERLDGIFYDARLRLTAPDRADDRIVIVDIDEAALAEIGRWPWNRKRMAELVDQLVDRHGVRLVAMDMVFAEPDEHIELDALAQLARTSLKGDAAYLKEFARLRAELDYDRRFAEAMRDRPVILGYFLSNVAAAASGELPAPVLPKGALAEGVAEVTHWTQHSANLPPLQRAAAGSGFLNPMVDLDGVLRRVPLLAEYRGDYYESLALAVVRRLRDDPPVVAGFPAAGAAIEWLDLPSAEGSYRIPVDRNVAALVPYLGAERSFHYISAGDVLKGRLPAGSLRDRIVLVGTTAAGLKDLRVTPVGSAYPGVEVQANLIVGLLDGTLKQKPAFLVGADMLQLFLAALLMIFLVPRLPPLRATLASLATLAILAWVNLSLWAANLVLPFAGALILVTALYTLDMSWGYFVESRDKRLMTRLFGQYVPPELVREMARNPGNYSLAGRSAELTVMFADIQAFTKMAESLSPTDVARLLNEYLNAMTAVIQRQRGTLDKYIGDAIMAFWGAPLEDPGHARHAVETALQMQAALVGLNASFAGRGWQPLKVGIGINSGQMTVGDMGSTVRKAYTVMGDSVNIASRLESLTRHYGVAVIVGEDTRNQISDLAFRELDRVRVKGRQAPVAIFEPLAAATARADELARWVEALDHFRARRWDEAQAGIEALRARDPDCVLYALYLDRIARFRCEPPADDWQGVTNFTSKDGREA
ncbi:MAG: adenylate/guanylate cyclase domain-containing protein [Rhodocyclales bacterium]|nr:adenylate/guanylate cyclase domain-containing protein [Rhodocyclales bacterium]